MFKGRIYAFSNFLKIKSKLIKSSAFRALAMATYEYGSIETLAINGIASLRYITVHFTVGRFAANVFLSSVRMQTDVSNNYGLYCV